MENERRQFLKYLVASGVVLAGSGGIAAFLSGCDGGEDEKMAEEYDFLAHLDRARIDSPTKQSPEECRISVREQERRALCGPPGQRVTFDDVGVPENAVLRFGVGVDDHSWRDHENDVSFGILLVDENSKEHTIYSHILNPGKNPGDRRWLDEIIPLKDFSGQKVAFVFKSTCKTVDDLSPRSVGWSEPKIRKIRKMPVRAADRVNVVLVILDTTRWDHLSCYGYGRITTPNLDRMARGGMVFENAISPSPWTLPAHASIFTGLFPCQHGAITKKDEDVLSGRPLPDWEHVLARTLKNLGYSTGGFVGGPFLKAKFGFAQGFDHYDDQWEGFDQKAGQINEKVFRWLKQEAASPFFLFVNYFDPHAPYYPPDDFDSPFLGRYQGDIDFSKFGPHSIKKGKVAPLEGADKRQAIDLYDSEILYTDYCLGQLMHKMDTLGLLEESLVIVTSDHGESFGEMGFWGHGFPIESQIRVPLIIHYPKEIAKPRRISHQVQTSSIYSTILSGAGIPLSSIESPSESTLDLVGQGKPLESAFPTYTYSERFLPKKHHCILRSKDWKYLRLWSENHGKEQIQEYVFQTEENLEEVQAVSLRNPQILESLREKCKIFRERALKRTIKAEGEKPESEPSEGIDEETREQLRALGYVK